jgi:hypothetical protein
MEHETSGPIQLGVIIVDEGLVCQQSLKDKLSTASYLL